METTTCIHEEHIEPAGNGIMNGTCKLCHQVRVYNTIEPREKPKVIKLGRINGAIVLPSNKDIPELTTQEAAELETARKAPVKEIPAAGAEQEPEDIRVEQTPQVYVGKSKNYRTGAHKWAKRCKECLSFYIHDDLNCCDSKHCPQRCPPRLRPQYRPRVEVTTAAEIAGEILNKGAKGRRQKYFEDNKEAILQDYQNLKLKEFYAKWHLNSKTWTPLKQSWAVPGKKKIMDRPKDIAKASKKEIGKQLPAFPPFNEQWSDYVKTNWFETYKALREQEVKR